MELSFMGDGSSQVLERTDSQNPVSSSINYLTCDFTLSDIPEGSICTPVFVKNFKSYQPLNYQQKKDDNGVYIVTCTVPSFIIQPSHFDVSIFSFNPVTNERITFPAIKIRVTQSGYIGDPQFSDVDPTLYEQLLKEMSDTKEIAESIRQDANNGVFNGKSAYEAAVEGGYTGTEEDFNTTLSKISDGDFSTVDIINGGNAFTTFQKGY